MSRSVEIYDTTLRDGSQLEGISLTVDDKLRIAEQLDWLGVHHEQHHNPARAADRLPAIAVWMRVRAGQRQRVAV